MKSWLSSSKGPTTASLRQILFPCSGLPAERGREPGNPRGLKPAARYTRTVTALVLVTLAVGTWIGCRGDYGTIPGDGDFLDTGETGSFFRAFQIDPRSEDSAGPQFVVAEDVNGDGLMDLVSAWNQAQPVQVHVQRPTTTGLIKFETVTLAGNVPVGSIAGLKVADFDLDGNMDIVLLIKETLLAGATCLDSTPPESVDAVLNGIILVYFGPSDPDQVTQALAWEDRDIKASFLVGATGSGTAPESGGFTSMAVGDIDGNGTMDIVVAWNPACDTEFPEVLIFSNTGAGAVRNGVWPVQRIADPFQCSEFTRVCATIKDIALGDIDRDGDQDIVVTYPAASTMNVRWYRNPARDIEDVCHRNDGEWSVGTIAQVPTGADVLQIGDIDRDEILDVVVRSSAGGLIQWFKGPDCPTTPTAPDVTDPFRHVPWQVYTLAEFTERTPEALVLGDLNGDRQLEVIASAGGGLLWFDSQTAPTVFDQWTENLILDDEPSGAPGAAPATTDPSVDPEEIAGTTVINSILVVDLDGDGARDLVVTLDRSGLSGVTNDAIAWFRNTR